MASTDPPEKNRDFARSLEASFPILSDPDGSVAKAYGVDGGGYAKRVTFYVDPDGIVRYVDRAVQTGTAGDDVASRLGELGFPLR